MRFVPIAVIVGVVTAACGSSPAGPTAQTRIDVSVGDLTNPKLGTPVPVPTVTGTLSGDFAAGVWDGSRWVSLGSPNRTTVPLQLPVFLGSPTIIHGEQTAPAGTYDRVRLILQGVTATIARGSGFGGITLSSDTTIQLGGSDRHVELLPSVTRFALEDDPSVRRVIVFELHSQQWLTASAAQSGQVEDQALQAAVSVTTRIEPR